MTVSPESFLAIEQTVLDRLRDNWEAIKVEVVKGVVEGVREDDHKKIEDAIALVQLDKAFDGDMKYFRAMAIQSFFFGVARYGDVTKAKTKPTKVKGLAQKMTEQSQAILGSMSKNVRRELRLLIADEYTRQDMQRVQKAEIIKAFVSSLNQVSEAEGSLHLVASLHTSRLATIGFCVESIARGSTTTMWNAMLDARTCPICASLHERVFSVELIFRRMQQVMEVTDVADLKRLAPWPSTSKANIVSFQEMTTSELHEKGYDAPPIHPLCRCFLDVSEVPLEELDLTTSQLGGRIPDITTFLSSDTVEEATRTAVSLTVSDVPIIPSLNTDGIED